MAEAAAAGMAELAVTDSDFAGRVAERKPFFERRIELFTQYKARQTEAIEAAKAAKFPIRVVLPDGSGEFRWLPAGYPTCPAPPGVAQKAPFCSAARLGAM